MTSHPASSHCHGATSIASSADQVTCSVFDCTARFLFSARQSTPWRCLEPTCVKVYRTIQHFCLINLSKFSQGCILYSSAKASFKSASVPIRSRSRRSPLRGWCWIACGASSIPSACAPTPPRIPLGQVFRHWTKSFAASSALINYYHGPERGCFYRS